MPPLSRQHSPRAPLSTDSQSNKRCQGGGPVPTCQRASRPPPAKVDFTIGGNWNLGTIDSWATPRLVCSARPFGDQGGFTSSSRRTSLRGGPRGAISKSAPGRAAPDPVKTERALEAKRHRSPRSANTGRADGPRQGRSQRARGSAGDHDRPSQPESSDLTEDREGIRVQQNQNHESSDR